MIRAALSLALLAACSTPGPPSATGDAPASKVTSTASPSEPASSALAQDAALPSGSAPSALAQDAPLPPASAAADSNAPTSPASSAAADPGERVPCKSVRDCWVSSTPHRHPIARPARFKKRDFKPCVDGEAKPVCGGDGFCAIGDVYKC